MTDSFITKDGKSLRRGYTTGSCAAAAAKAAAIMLLTGRGLDSVYLTTPNGTELTLAVHEICIGENAVSCGIVKDSGDDPDITDGITVYALVEKTAEKHIVTIDGGEGIGRVTKPGLDQPVGSAAINSIPRRMMTEALLAMCEDCGYDGGLRVVISAPEGVEIAKKTFNPRLGIIGGISILGTTGVVEPMSDEAVVATIRAELSVRRAEGKRYALFTPGNYGADFINNELRLDPEAAVMTANFIGDAFGLAVEAGFSGALLVGHIGKLIKLAGGVFNTHSRYGDGRAEIFASHARICGASPDITAKIMDSAVTDDMLSILACAGLKDKVMAEVMLSIEENLARRVGSMDAGVMTFSKVHGVLGMTEKAAGLLRKIREEN